MSEIDIYKNIAEQMKSDKEQIKELKAENERLKELCNKYEEEHDNEFKTWKEERSQLRDYKTRCENANGKVQLIRDLGFDYDGFNDVNNLKLLIDELVRIAGETKDILQGKSDE